MSRLWAVFPVSLGKRWVILNSYRSARRVSWDPERPHLPCAPRALLGPPSPGGFSSAATPPTPPSAAPAGWGLLGGRAHRPQGAIWQAGFLLRTLPHLGLLPASSASEKHTLGIL